MNYDFLDNEAIYDTISNPILIVSQIILFYRLTYKVRSYCSKTWSL